MISPNISVIVPCYNQAQYLDECLQSVLDQSYIEWECIIVNDGSIDHTEDVVKKWLIKDPRFHYIKKQNGGLSSARNAGIKLAAGEWIQFLDCDDVLESNKLQEGSCYFNKGIDIIISGYRYFESEEGRVAQRIFGRSFFLPETCISKDDHVDVKHVFKDRNPFVISAPLYRGRIFEVLGGFDERLKSLEDWEFNLRCALNNFVFHHIGYNQNSKVLIRLHDTSLMRNEDHMNKNHKALVDILNQNMAYVNLFGRNETFQPSIFSTYGLKNLIILFSPPIIRILVLKITKQFNLHRF